MVVVGVIGVLTALVMPAVSRAGRQGKAARCLGQFHQFGIALQMYGDDHGGRFPPNRPGRGVKPGETWVAGWLGLPGADCTNTAHLRESLLAPYIRSASIWRCPSAGPVVVAGQSMDRVRTISLNGFLGDSGAGYRGIAALGFDEVDGASPSGVFSWVEERIDTINDGSFALQSDFQKNQPNKWVLRDKPAVLHANGGHLAFLDGHVERHRWLDSRTLVPERDDSRSPGNQDVAWLQAMGRPRGDFRLVTRIP